MQEFLEYMALLLNFLMKLMRHPRFPTIFVFMTFLADEVYFINEKEKKHESHVYIADIKDVFYIRAKIT